MAARWSRVAAALGAFAAALTLAVAAAFAKPLAPPSRQDAPPSAARPDVAALDAVLASRRDLWGEAALLEPGGPSFDFFARLLPPLGRVDAAFGACPLVLSAPRGAAKLPLASDGRGLALPADHPSWREPSCGPATFWIVDPASASGWRPFGADRAQLEGPTLRDGWLPIVRFVDHALDLTADRSGGIELELFASTRPDLHHGGAVVFARVMARDKGTAMPLAKPELAKPFKVEFGGATLPGRFAFGGFEALHAPPGWLLKSTVGWFAISTTPSNEDGFDDSLRGSVKALSERAELSRGDDSSPFVANDELAACRAAWRAALGSTFRLVTPEARVNDAWRAVIVGTLMTASGDALLCSAQNASERVFAAECGDAARALMRFGVADADDFVAPLLRRPAQAGLAAWDAAWKATLLRDWFDLARANGRAAGCDPFDLVARVRGRLDGVRAGLDAALAARDATTGLLAKQAYGGDDARPVDSLATNASFWRALRDIARLLGALGQPEEAAAAQRYEDAAASLRAALLAAVARSERTTAGGLFVPMALDAPAPAYDELTATREGSCWNRMAPYAAASHLFPPGDPRPRALLDWQAQHGGLCMGLLRCDQHSGLFADERALDNLDTLRRVETLLDEDDPDAVVVAFYGKLAQGMTRDTCVSGEATGLVADASGERPLYLPPNSAANAFFLATLRGMVVHERDRDDDGLPDELELAFATPRAWLDDGKRIELAAAPTSFGPVGFTLESRLAAGVVVVRVEAPPTRPRRLRLRLRLPAGWHAIDATSGESGGAPRELPLLDEPRGTTLDLSATAGAAPITVRVERKKA